MSELPTWLTFGETARHLGISKSVLSLWLDEGKLRHVKTPAGNYRIFSDGLNSFSGKSISDE